VTTVVIPFAGVEGKTRLHASRRLRRELSLAMLGDVLAAGSSAGTVRVVTSDSEGAALASEAGAHVLDDPGGGQGPAVQAALDGVDITQIQEARRRSPDERLRYFAAGARGLRRLLDGIER